MYEYRRRHSSASAPPIPFQGTTPTTPQKPSQPAKSSGLAGVIAHFDLDDNVFGDILGTSEEPLHEGTVEEEYKKYVTTPPSPRNTNILHFWEVRVLFFCCCQE